jgi:hypothetical protein
MRGERRDFREISEATKTFEPDRDRSHDGVLIFCGISLVLVIVALWAAASGHADMSAVMF